jgi:site-specific DNA recombinase
MRVVFYLRMSTDRQDTSIPQQREALVRLANKQGYRVVREYVDEGISGDATHKRKAFQKMIADAASGSFDRILCFDQDRFGRFDMIEAGWWIMPLREAGVGLETIAQGVIDWSDFAGRLTYAVAQEGKHQFLRDLSRNSLRGQMDRARLGEGMYGAPASYGYRREGAAVGRRTITKLVPHPGEARIVRMIFETYAASDGTLLAVGEMLNRKGIPAPSGGTWHRNAVRRILRNQTYVGDYVWGKTMSGRYHVRVGDEIVVRRGAKKKTSNEPIIHRDTLPALVSRDLFDRVQELLNGRRKATRRPGSIRPLSGLIVCGCCGSPMHVNFGDYRCSRSVDFGDGSRCQMPIARGQVVLDAIVESLQKQVLAPKAIAATKAKLESLVRAQRRSDGQGGAAALSQEIADLDKKIAEGLDRIPLLPKTLVPDMAKALDAMRAQRDELTRQRDAMRSPRKGERAPIQNRIEDAVAAAYSLRKSIPAGDVCRLNEDLRRLGLRVYFDVPRARVEVDPLHPVEPVKLGRKPKGTRNARAAATCTGIPAAGRRGSRTGRD